LLLTISKKPAYGPKGEVIIGQCEPYTSGWRLRVLDGGREETLLEGNYYDLRQVQMRCTEKGVEDIRKVVEEMKPHLATGGTASQLEPAATPKSEEGVESTQILGRAEIFQAMADAEAGKAGPASPEKSGLLLERQEQCLIVRFVDPIAAAQDADRLRAIFDSLLSHEVKAYVLDLTLLQRVSSRVIRELVRFRENAAGAGRGFAIVTKRQEVVRTLESMNLLGFLPHYEDTGAAVKALSA
jgi:anti-anti-sigma regulatory factor